MTSFMRFTKRWSHGLLTGYAKKSELGESKYLRQFGRRSAIGWRLLILKIRARIVLEEEIEMRERDEAEEQ